MSTAADALDAVTEAAQLRQAATDQLRGAVAAAHTQGAEITAIAAAAGIGRQTVYRWLALDGDGQTVDVAQALDDALAVTAGLVSATTASQVMAGVRSRDLGVKMRRLQLGLKNLPPDALTSLDSEDRARLDLGMLVWEKATAAFQDRGTYIARVQID